MAKRHPSLPSLEAQMQLQRTPCPTLRVPLSLCSPHSWGPWVLGACPRQRPGAVPLPSAQACREIIPPSFLCQKGVSQSSQTSNSERFRPLCPWISGSFHLWLRARGSRWAWESAFQTHSRVLLAHEPCFAEGGAKSMAVLALSSPPKKTLPPYLSFKAQLKRHS